LRYQKLFGIKMEKKKRSGWFYSQR